MRPNSLFHPRLRFQIFGQFLKFGIVGFTGLMVDWGSVLLLRPSCGLTAAAVLAYFIAATNNWFLNRLWTFGRSAAAPHHFIFQWLHFLVANSLGFLLNRGTVFILFETVAFTRIHPFPALAAGALAGMIANFNLSRRLVFRAPSPEAPIDPVQTAVSVHPPLPVHNAAPTPQETTPKPRHERSM